ncbi:unnamed protein product [Rotaria magnacalcarata]|uniref:Uncharacterized protein n=1 Tax=Rotaria magnacalcarata TaxID=392030 RepID=A0A820BUD5_9BILA|nr:unnamed protein product [Rotaria magnacalcarata]CAF2164034.1 unnamed protein product [Rotaria magnacalcarata]CAF4064147.1 unnamed protein product [Rotaria magnacalcarata]CAF4206602.1 unnamed protein product [Rotaria magnacalcarata]
MGNNLIKFDPYMSRIICLQEYADPQQIGTVYFVKHKAGSNIAPNEISKNTHYGLAIDITGSSTKRTFCATHYDLCIEKPTNHFTYIDCEFKERPWDYYYEVREIGKIPSNEIQKFYVPSYFAEDLRFKLINNVHYAMSMKNQGTKWSSMLNCQTFTRAAIQYLGFDFPSDIIIVSDCLPSMVDIYMSSRLTTAYVKEQKTELQEKFSN